VEVAEWTYKPPTGAPYVYNSSNVSSYYAFSDMRGVDIPGFHKRKRAGELLPFTDFTQYEVKAASTGSYELTYLPDGSNWSCPNDYPNPSGSIIGKIEMTKLLEGHDFEPYVQAAAAAVYSRGWDFLTFSAELGKTVSMCETILADLLDLWKRRKRMSPKQFNNWWLKARYGLSQSVYDVQDSLKALEMYSNKRTRVTERVGNTYRATDAPVVEQVTTGWGVITHTTMTDYTVSVRGHVAADFSPAAFRFNPVVTGYELLPWSFVIDWAVNINQLLQAYSFLLLCDSSTAAGGFLVTRTCTETWNTEHAPGWHGNHDRTRVTVEKLTVRVPTKISLKPQAGPGLNTDRIRDLLALFGKKGWTSSRPKRA
jgi:hypothetical protein